MYFIELLIKKFAKKEKPTYSPYPSDENSEANDYELCEHLFMPIDSTNEILSCSKCGILVNRSDLKNKNFFMNRD